MQCVFKMGKFGYGNAFQNSSVLVSAGVKNENRYGLEYGSNW